MRIVALAPAHRRCERIACIRDLAAVAHTNFAVLDETLMLCPVRAAVPYASIKASRTFGWSGRRETKSWSAHSLSRGPKRLNCSWRLVPMTLIWNLYEIAEAAAMQKSGLEMFVALLKPLVRQSLNSGVN